MKNIAACALCISATATFYANNVLAQDGGASTSTRATATAPAPAPARAPGASAPVPGLQFAGQGEMRFLGFEIYRARLWVGRGFDAERYAAHPLALELTYQRGFTAEAIAKRSIEEMRRVGDFSPEQGVQWQKALQAALPDVKPGDRLVGLHRPGGGTVFKMDGRVVGDVPDPEFSRLFFGIWLSPKTSEPGLRQQLMAATPTVGSLP